MTVGKRLLLIARENWLLLVIIGLIAGGYAFLRTPESDVATLEMLDAQIASGRPTLLEFYSNG